MVVIHVVEHDEAQYGRAVALLLFTNSGKRHSPHRPTQDVYHGRTHMGLPEKADILKPLILSYIHFCISHYTTSLALILHKHYHKKYLENPQNMLHKTEESLEWT